MILKKCFCLPAAIIFLLQASLLSQTEYNIIGRWESVNRSSTGIGSGYEFFPDGKFSFTTGAMIDYIYHLDNNRLIITFVNVFTNRVTRDTSFIEIKEDSLFQKKNIDQTEANKIYTRSGRAYKDKPLIIGTWKSDNKAGQTGYYSFTENGTLYFRLPFEIKEGHFTVDGNKITFKYPEISRTENFRIKKEFLTIFSDNGSEQTYYRIKPATYR